MAHQHKSGNAQVKQSQINCELCKKLNKIVGQIHGHLTRTQSNIHTHRADTTFGQRFILYKGGNLWNSLSQDLKTTSSTNQFKIKLKRLFHSYRLVVNISLFITY